MNVIVNTLNRLSTLFPGYFPAAKHNHYADFGYPEHLTFDQIEAMFRRNGLARAAVKKTAAKTWQDTPEIFEREGGDETALETEMRQRFDDLRLWQKFAKADALALMGGYSGVIMRLADNKRFNQPVDRVGGGLDGLVDVIVASRGQLRVTSWNTDETSADYGQPTMFGFNEAQPGDEQAKARIFDIHPDRVLIWSEDGTVHNRSMLEAGYNDLIDMEKIKGAGGEGFWKNAKSAPVIQVDKEARIADIAAAMGVPADEVADAMDKQIDAYNKGFDKLLMLQGMEAKTLGVTLPSPEHFFAIALQSFAASIEMPLKILVGTQTGERASTEDAREWNQTITSRRVTFCRPMIADFLLRMERFKILPERDWIVEWADLTESSPAEKIERAAKMAAMNKQFGGREIVFTSDEIRAVADYEPLSDADRYLEDLPEPSENDQ
jgi:hypothetical protein